MNLQVNWILILKIIGITETRLKTKKYPANGIEILNYNTGHTPTEADSGGLLLHTSKEIN